MTVDSLTLADISYLSSFSMVVDCTQWWWQRWSFRQSKCSHSIILTLWPWCCDSFFGIWNVSYVRHLHVLSPWFHLSSTYGWTTPPHLQQVMDLGHSVQWSFLRLSCQFQVVFIFCCGHCWVIIRQYPVAGAGQVSLNEFFVEGVACDLWLPPADSVSPKGDTGLQSTTMLYVREYVVCHIREIWVD